jgi:glycogen operon protein
MDSLRYWVLEMHVDGFRFDLAATLAREFYDVDKLAAFFELVQQDPVVSQVKLIAEPWDVGPGGYQVWQLPAAVDRMERSLPRHGARLLARRASGARRVRVTTDRVGRPVRALRPPPGGIHQLRHRPRRLHASRPRLVQREAQRRERRGRPRRHRRQPVVERRRRGRHRRPAVLALRSRQQRNFLATLLLSQGVPMLLHGDELGRTQGGNNNGYNQDNDTTWVDWSDTDSALVEFTATLSRCGGASHLPAQPLLRRPPRSAEGSGCRGRGSSTPAHRNDIAWLRPDGTLMEREDWESGFGLAVGMFLNGQGIRERDSRGQPIVDKHFIVLFNAGDAPIDFRMPDVRRSPTWDVLVDTGGQLVGRAPVEPGTAITLESRSLVALREHRERPVGADRTVAPALEAAAGRRHVPGSGRGANRSGQRRLRFQCTRKLRATASQTSTMVTAMRDAVPAATIAQRGPNTSMIGPAMSAPTAEATLRLAR